MCGRYTRFYTWEQVHAFLSAFTLHPSNMEPRYNICPTTMVDVIVQTERGRELKQMRWALVPKWWKRPLKDLSKYATFNVRAETIDTKPVFKDAWKQNKRCIIPVSGYYEWQHIPGEKKPQPWFFTSSYGPVMGIAGLWDEWTDTETGRTILSCTMVITEPNMFVAEVHDRMPVLLQPHQFDAWLSGEGGKEMLVPAPEDALKKIMVSKRVNSSRADDHDHTLVDPIE